MGICRLCLDNIDGTGISNPAEAIDLLQTFLPHMNRTLINIPVICEICLENVNTANELLENKNKTDTKIIIELRRLRVAKIDLEAFHKDLHVSKTIGVCRICLNVINRPRIFLCENSTNILRHDFLRIMLNYCDLKMNLEMSNKPVMCLKCWEHLQITYSFKKTYTEVERKIREYCREFRLRNRNVSIEILERVRNYFSDEYCEIIESNFWRENSFTENICSKVKMENTTPKSIRRKRRVKRENEKFIKHEEFSGIGVQRKYRQRIVFSPVENKMLMKIYYEVTNKEKNFSSGYWNRLSNKWSEVKPEKPITGRRLSCQIRNILRRKLLPKTQLERIKAQIDDSEIIVQEQVDQAIQNYSDSDDSFMEEAVHSSFTPHIKSEPLAASDIEFNYNIEAKLEPESDCESLPQLERMDLPHLQFKIENICSLEVKREAYDTYMHQDVELSRTAEDINKTRRVSLRCHNKEKDSFQCPDCNFNTTDKASADRHMRLHQRRNQKIHQCTICSYRISNKWLFNRHMKKHKSQDEIPVLLPDAFIL